MWTPPPASRAEERGYTCRKCVDPATRPEDLRRPGHVFPLVARRGGVLVRNGHTEATVDLCRLAGLPQCGLCCEIMRDDGTMMRTTELLEKAKEWGLKVHDHPGPPGLLPPPRQACGAGGHRQNAHQVRRLPDLRLHQRPDRRAPRGPGEGRHRRRRKCAVPGPLRVPHRGRVRLPALRLRGAAGRRHAADRGRRAGAWCCICGRRAGASASSTS